jgi:hypothetical protein
LESDDLVDEYRHYQGYYPQIAIDKVCNSRSKAQADALSFCIRQAIEPLMAAVGMKPDEECSGCGGHGNCCTVCLFRWKKMELINSGLLEQKEEREQEERGEKKGSVLSLSPLAEQEGGEWEEQRKSKRKLRKKGKRATISTSHRM